MIEPQTHLLVVSKSMQVLKELLEIPPDQWTEHTFLRAHAHLSVVTASAKWLAEWCAAKSFVQKVTSE